MKSIFGTTLLLLLLGCGGGGPQVAAAKGDILYRNICLCGYRGWERKYIPNGRPPLAPKPSTTPSPISPDDHIENPHLFPLGPPSISPRSLPVTIISEDDPTTPTPTKPAAAGAGAEAEADAEKKLLFPRETVYEDLIIAYFLKMTFYQDHLKLNFTFTRECAPGAPCHDHSRTHKRCQKLPILPIERRRYAWKRKNYHEICYQVRDLPKWDQYWFDGQRREAKVENNPYVTEAQPIITDEIERECGGECKQRFGMEVVVGKQVWRSTVDRITGEDDMCFGCP